MPCPVCTGRLVFLTVTPTKPPSDLEDSVFACDHCGTQVIRTAFRKATRSRPREASQPEDPSESRYFSAVSALA